MSRSAITILVASLASASTSLAQTGRACESPSPVSLGASVEIVEPTAGSHTLSDVLSGRIPGVSVMRSSGVVGTGSRIRIRGPSGILIPQQPLLYIDGIRVDGEQQSILLDAGGQAPSRIDDIPVEQVECVYVLRGPAATARYGTDAAGGIIHVITRRVAADSTRIRTFLTAGVADDATDYPANFGTESASPIGGCSRASAALGRCVPGPIRSWSPLEADSPFRTAPLVRGGGFVSLPGPTTSLGVGVHASREQGVLINNEQTQYGANATGQWRPSGSLNVEGDFWYMGGRASLPQVGALSLSILNSALLGASADDPVRRGYRTLPLSVLKELGTDQSLRRFGGTARTIWKLKSWLSARATLGYEDSRADDEQFDPYVLGTQPPTVNPPRILGQSELRSKQTSANLLLTASYARVAVKYTTEVGVDYLKEDQLEKTHVRDTGTPSFFESTTNFPWEATTKGLILRQSVAAMDDRLQVDAGVRHDFLNGQFSEIDNPTYPFASASWQAISPRRLDDQHALSSLRLRAAYGESGDKRPYRPALSLAITVPPNSGPNGAAAPVERTRELEGGFDAVIFGNRGSIRATYFARWVSDGLTTRPIPPGTGTGGGFQVVGAIAEWQNRGVELGVKVRPLEMPNVYADVDVSFTSLENKLTSLGDTPPNVRTNDRLEVGYPLFERWAFSYTVTDQNNDGVVVPSEVVAGSIRYLGGPVPTREIGVAPTITFRRSLTLGALFDYRGGFRSVNLSGRLRCVANCAELYVPGTSLDEQARAVDPNDAMAGWIEDASFLKLREVTLSFPLPRVSRKANSRVVISARNLWTHTNYSGLDPEISQTGQSAISQVEFFTPPVPRSYSIRLDIGW